MKKKSVLFMASLAALICLLVYLRALSCGFVNWDDGDYVYNNPLITNLNIDFIKMIFTSIPADFYIPLTTISFAIDYHFWGLNPMGFHLTNILFHAANVGLFVIFADQLLRGRFTVEGSNTEQNRRYVATLLLAALFWGLHPLRVESVVWVTERKDVLNGFFTISSLIFYLRYVSVKDSNQGKGTVLRAYLISLVLFMMSLMSKQSSIVLPVMLLILDWYPLERLRKGCIRSVVLEKLPFFILSSAIIPVIIMKYSELDTFHGNDFFPIAMRVFVSGNALFDYIKLSVYPVGILPFYNLPLLIPQIFIIKTMLVVCFICCSIYFGRSRPWITATLLLFIIPLIPILPFLGNGASIALAARYTYIPALIPSILASVIIVRAYQALVCSYRIYYVFMLTALVVFALIFYVVMTERLIGDWKDAGTMWSKVIAYQPFDRAYFYRGLFYADTGNYSAAAQDYTSCIQVTTQENQPNIYNLYAFRAEALIQAGRFEEGLSDINSAIAMFPHQLYFYYRGLAFKGLGMIKEAQLDFIRAGRAKGKMCWFSVGSPLK